MWGEMVHYGAGRNRMSEENIIKTENEALRKPLIGRFDHRLDAKCRFTVPSRWQERMGNPADVYVMRSLTGEPCLEVFSAADFEKRLEPFKERALSDSRIAAFLRNLSETTELISVDVQNRIRIPDAMLAYAGLDADIVLYGSGYHFEVWSLKKRPVKTGNESESIAALAAESKELNF